MMPSTTILVLLACGAAPTFAGNTFAARRQDATSHAHPNP